MRNIITIFSLVLLVSVQTPVGQFFKVPVLVSHFMQHQQRTGMSLVAFLQEHYGSDHSDADSREDQQLPFKNINCFTMASAVVPIAFQAQQPVHFIQPVTVALPNTHVPNAATRSIFHPPRV
jgi:hypothetical protein